MSKKMTEQCLLHYYNKHTSDKWSNVNIVMDLYIVKKSKKLSIFPILNYLNVKKTLEKKM